MTPDLSIELETPGRPFALRPDRRPRMAEPLPVKLVTVEDARLPAAAGLEVQLDEFYVGFLAFVRDPSTDAIVYHAENFCVRFDVIEPPLKRDSCRALGIEVQSLSAAEKELIDRGIEHSRQKTLSVGHESLLLLDPAGNWIELTERRAI
jgi:hypothetical protein